MTIESTAPPQARHKPRAPQKRVKKEFPAAVVKIVKEPVPSKKDEGWHYFWGEHVNTGRHDWSILCKEDQVSWVIEQMESNVQLTEGFHFADQRVKTENGYETRAILDEQFYLDEPEPEEEPPMTWQEVPVVPQPDAEIPADPEVMRRMYFTVSKGFYRGLDEGFSRHHEATARFRHCELTTRVYMTLAALNQNKNG